MSIRSWIKMFWEAKAVLQGLKTALIVTKIIALIVLIVIGIALYKYLKMKGR